MSLCHRLCEETGLQLLGYLQEGGRCKQLLPFNLNFQENEMQRWAFLLLFHSITTRIIVGERPRRRKKGGEEGEVELSVCFDRISLPICISISIMLAG